MMRGLWNVIPILGAALALFPASAQLLDTTNLVTPVTSRNSVAGTIAAGNANGQVPLMADPVAGGGDMFDVVTDNSAAIVTLVLPGGTEVTSSNAVQLGYTYATYTNSDNVNSLIPAAFNLKGSHTLFTLPASQPSGTYNIKVNTTGAQTPVLVIANFFTSSPVRAGAVTDRATYKIGDTVVITGLVFNGGNALTNATVTARIVNTANLTATPPEIALVDFGPNDNAAGDGLYTGTYTATAAGKFLAVVKATGSAAPSGNYTRTATVGFNVIQPAAKFTAFADAGVDDNANGLADRVVVTATINVQKAGTYRYGISLQASNSKVVKATAGAALAVGSQTMAASFAAKDIVKVLGVNGPYTLRDAALVLLDGIDNPLVDYGDNVGTTAAYNLTSLDQGAIYFTGQNTVTGIDNNADSKFDTLRVQSGVMVATAGTYQWSAALVNSTGTEIAFYDKSQALTAGANNINFDFSGSAIGQSCSSGIYSVRSVLLFGAGGSSIQDHLVDTPSFTPAQFANTACFLVSATPNAGLTAAVVARPFTFAFTSPNGSSDLKQVSFIIGASTAAGTTCNVAWFRADHTIRIYDDQGDGGYSYGSDTGNYEFGNSQCTIAYTNAITESGNNLTMNLSISFAQTYTGTKNIYMEALNNTNTDTGPQLFGSLTITPTSPCDTNVDGSTTVTDVQGELSEALGSAQAVHDLNSDGRVSVVDVQKIINAALSLGCITP